MDKAHSKELGGTGLGLSIVKHIALAYRGRVDVDSILGTGSTFRIFLPLNLLERDFSCFRPAPRRTKITPAIYR